MHMAEKNRQTGQELDRVFMQRKNRESDTAQIEEQIESIYKTIQNRINDLEPDKLKTYNDLHDRQRELADKCVHNENKLQEINNRIRNLESDDKSGAHRKEFANLERVYQSLKKDATSLQEELDIASLDPKEAHTEFVNRVNNFKADTKALTDKCNSLREENTLARRSLDEMDNTDQDDDGDQAKYELLVQRDKEMTAFMDKFDDTRNALIAEQGQIKEMNVALLEHISKGIEDSNSMPSQDIMNEMDSTKSFKERNLATQKQTLEDLQVQKKKREKELELMEQSEPKMANDLEEYKSRMTSMKQEMKEFEDIKGLREAFEGTKQQLVELRMSYQKRRDAMRQQVQAASVEHEAAKRALTNNDTARELDDTEKRLKHYERTIFEIKEFVTNKSKETDFDAVKGQCLKVLEALNLESIRKAQNAPSMNQAQAKY
jgi:intraflagellar transport protein 74